MPLFVKARSFLRNLFSTRRVEVDLDQEVHAHLELLSEENMRAGMPPKEAQRAARIELGGIEPVLSLARYRRGQSARHVPLPLAACPHACFPCSLIRDGHELHGPGLPPRGQWEKGY